MENEQLVKETDSRLLYNSLAKKNNANAENTVKNEIKPPETSLYANRSNENPPKTGLRFKAALQNNSSQQGKTEVSSRTQPTSGIRFKAETSGNTTTNKTAPDLDSIAKKIPPKYSIAAELQRQEKEKNNHILLPSNIKSIEDIKEKNNKFSYSAEDGTTITPSEDLIKFVEDYYSDQFNVGKTTADIVINDAQLEALHKYLTNGIKNMERPANIGVGAWNKQVQTDLKWIDDMFGQSSNFAKALKTLPAINIGIDTIRGVGENIKNDAGWKETVSDAVIDIGLGTGEALASWAFSGLVGGLPGVIIGIVAGLAFDYFTDGVEAGGKTIAERIDSLF